MGLRTVYQSRYPKIDCHPLSSRSILPMQESLPEKVVKCLLLTSPLPSDRIKQTPAFSVCGLDFAGPLYVNNFGELQTSYIVLFTCGVTRALHLELVSDMTTNTFLLAFRRLLERRENCKTLENSSKVPSQLKRKKYQQLFLKQLWHRWENQYLLDLRTAHSVKNPETHPELKVGDTVLIEENTKNKLLWKLGKIERTLQGRDY
ncbi:uncharacterized protein TNCV_249221 [Trichonephila clavipes]|nr:uncharacterized protein TNCV_249221 [Trichonephila clavipes]